MTKAKTICFLIILAFLFSALNTLAAQINSTSYKQTVIVSTGGENVSSSSYKMGIATGIINLVINSTSYINKLGFFHLLLLADNQPCTSASQCEGGYCCSSLCKSSACPVPQQQTGGGGAAGAGGGGGGGGIPGVIEEEKKVPVADFSISPSSVKEYVALGAAKTRNIKIKNTGEVSLQFELSISTISDMVFLSETRFSLQPSEERSIEINVIGKKLGSYFGSISAEAQGIKKTADIVVEVESENALFDAKIDIPFAYKEVEPGGELKAQITLLNVGPPRKVDVTTTYIIKDKQANVIYESSETFAVERQTSFVKSFKIPKNIKPGDYLAIIEVRYENSFAVSSEIFRVVEKEATIFPQIVKSKAAIALIFVVLVGFLVLFGYLLLPRHLINKIRFGKQKNR